MCQFNHGAFGKKYRGQGDSGGCHVPDELVEANRVPLLEGASATRESDGRMGAGKHRGALLLRQGYRCTLFVVLSKACVGVSSVSLAV